MADEQLERMFPDLDLDAFWEDSEYAEDTYRGGFPTDEVVVSVEAELGFRLPASYVALMRARNGGMPRNTCCPAPSSTTWSEDHVALTAIMGIGREKECSLAGRSGSRFLIEEWGYPAIGVYFADCPSAGHDMIAFDYRDCGPEGEPRVVHVDQEVGYRITVLAPDFVGFVRALRPESDYDFD
ncbi:SMI1/KNR4 family protein [Actinoplanes sp. ATCC 53533]|uniref:SMI1/KNR4 family protein n=1 Tax=Actinoplanes sp. ATCC 53533 TaxID=1288362 RepID=UPI001F28EC78|nr:SMI1/KNR4 family protein [Actinoplanes sp. ATCC 53533]